MSLRRRLLTMAVAAPALAGCSALQSSYDDVQADMGKSLARQTPYVRPGLGPLYDKAADPAPLMSDDAARSTLPVPPPEGLLPFPPGRLPVDRAEILLAGDPMALRFLALKDMAAKGLVPVDDAALRRDANLGALLPLTAPLPPAAGLEKPIPPVSQVVGEVNALGQGRGSESSRAAERDFLIDRLLPRDLRLRQSWSPHDLVSARQLRDRLGRLEDAGLITPEQRTTETAALDALIAGGTLPETAIAEVKPPPPPAKPTKPSGGRGNRMPGGVSGQLVVIPSPSEVTAPALAAGSTAPAGLHLLSMGTAAHGDKAWEALKKEHPELADLGHTVSRADLGELGVTYRLIAGPLPAARAETLCAALRPRGQACTPTAFPTTQ